VWVAKGKPYLKDALKTVINKLKKDF
jgi:hypothetical protein